MSVADPAGGGAAAGWRTLPVRRYLVLMLVAVSLPILGLTAVVAWRYAEFQREQFEAEVAATTRIVQAVTDREVLGVMETLRALAGSPALQAGDIEAFHRQTAELGRLLNGVIVLRTTDGRQIANSLVPWGGALPDRSMVSAWDDQALASTEPIVSDHFVGIAGGQHSFAIMTAVRRDGAPIYLLHIGLAADRLRDALLKLGLPERRVGAVLDTRGVAIARTLNHDQVVGTPSPIASRLLRDGRSGRGLFTSREGRDVVWVAQASSLTGLISVATAPAEELSEQRRRALAVTVLAGVVLLGVSIVAAHLFSRPLDGALRRLAASGAALGRREPVPARPETIREIAAVRQALLQAASDLAEHEASRELVLHELDHRVKNILATVVAITSLAAREEPAANEAFRARLMGRILGLARTHDLLVRGGGGDVSLQDVIGAELGIHEGGDGGRISLSGPVVPLRASAAHAMGMLIHELATNAAKYGALSVPEGRVEVCWRLGAGPEAGASRLHLCWTETGGPPVTPPTRSGFGSRLIARGLARQLHAEVHTEWAREGVRFRLSMPATQLRGSPAPAAAPVAAPA